MTWRRERKVATVSDDFLSAFAEAASTLYVMEVSLDNDDVMFARMCLDNHSVIQPEHSEKQKGTLRQEKEQVDSWFYSLKGRDFGDQRLLIMSIRTIERKNHRDL